MYDRTDELRVRNPFRDPLVTELIEDADRYHRVFSEQILVGETSQVFQPSNVVLLGPQGTGKSMLLNLIRYQALNTWIASGTGLPGSLRHMAPFLGLSINLVRASFHVFGRRSIARALTEKVDPELDSTCAADYLTHYLFREFARSLQFLQSPAGQTFLKWLDLDPDRLSHRVGAISTWQCWSGYYEGCTTLQELVSGADERLRSWQQFLNFNIHELPTALRERKSSMEAALHEMGNLVRGCCTLDKPAALFVVIDQYEVLPELNRSHGSALQRIINALIKARDPVVFYKIGARTHDWGKELRIWGADSRIEVQRDYAVIDLAQLLMRSEDGRSWLFPEFARDVAEKRLIDQGYEGNIGTGVGDLFDDWSHQREAKLYFRSPLEKYEVLRTLSVSFKAAISAICGTEASAVDLRLAAAWVLQQLKRRVAQGDLLAAIPRQRWNRRWWKKERIEIALLQVASIAHQKRRYFGWKTILSLSGGNVTAFLLLCGEIWDAATKAGLDPLAGRPFSELVQTEGIYQASMTWANRDSNEQEGGQQRHEVVSRIAAGVRQGLISDLAISNPGHSGFSLSISELLARTEQSQRLLTFLNNAVSWAILEERPHTSKHKDSTVRRKWYIHPLLAPAYGIPHTRVKEPFYTNVETVYRWVFEADPVAFSTRRAGSVRRGKEAVQLSIFPEGPDEATVG